MRSLRLCWLIWSCIGGVVLGCDQPSAQNKTAAPQIKSIKNEQPKPASQTIYSYVDDAGNIRMAARIEDIPPKQRDQVVATDMKKDRQQRLQSDRLIVLDLRKQEQGQALNYSIVDLADLSAGSQRDNPNDPGSLGRNLVRRWFGADNTSSQRVILYSAAWCGFCKQTAAFLRQQGVAFDQRDIEQDRQAALELQNKLLRAGLKGGGIPVLDINGTLVIGFNKPRILALLQKQ